MGKFVNNIAEFNKYCEENEVEFIDFRFTDIKGAWHHISYRASAVDDKMIEAGLPFDGSSYRSIGNQSMNQICFLDQMLVQHLWIRLLLIVQ